MYRKKCNNLAYGEFYPKWNLDKNLQEFSKDSKLDNAS